jgi:hypothetical protein
LPQRSFILLLLDTTKYKLNFIVRSTGWREPIVSSYSLGCGGQNENVSVNGGGFELITDYG